MPYIITIAFYKKEDWPRFLQMADDRKDLEDTWEEWFSNYLGSKMGLKSQGFEVHDYIINLDELQQYCKEKGLKNTGKTRSEFVAGKPGNRVL
jgi:hypothetical protein